MTMLLAAMLFQVPTSQPACPSITWEWNTQGGLGYQPQTFAEVYVYDWLTLYSDNGEPVKVKWPSAGQIYTHPDGLDAYLVCYSLISDIKSEYCAYFETDWWNCDRPQPTTTTTGPVSTEPTVPTVEAPAPSPEHPALQQAAGRVFLYANQWNVIL